MPLFEYTCESCHERSELLITGADEPECPRCGSRNMHKEFSTFSAHGETVRNTGGSPTHTHSPGCGCCTGSQESCGLN